jgi:hypothetical protein
VSRIIVLDSGPLGFITHPQDGCSEVIEATIAFRCPMKHYVWQLSAST